MVEQASGQARLCPHCANSIAAEAVDCPYCGADFESQFAPSWLNRDEPAAKPRVGAALSNAYGRIPAIPEKFLWIGGVVAIALVAFLGGGYMQRNQLAQSSEVSQKQIQAKDKMIQTQEAQLAQTRQQLNDNSRQLAEMKSKLEENRKELSLAQQRLAVAARQADRLKASRPPVMSRGNAAPVSYPAAPPPQPARRTTAAGVYETVRPTAVHEDPTSASRVISQIEKGTRINVVSATGDWLEVRSKRGNPPGYVRSGDVRPGSAVN
jgi:hypothetical protein